MKTLYKKNIWFNAAFILILIVVGYLSNSNAMLGDALFCLTLMTISIAPKSLAMKIYTPLLTAISVIMCWYTFSLLQTSITEFDISDAPQLWSLPVLAVIFIVKILLVFAAVDTKKTDENKKAVLDITKLYKFSVVITAVTIVIVFASYLMDFFIEGALAFAISFIALTNSGKAMIDTFKKIKPKEDK